MQIIDEHSDTPTEPMDGSEEESSPAPDQKEDEPSQSQESSYAENVDDSDEIMAQLQAENEKLRLRIEKMKRKMQEAERKRNEAEEQHRLALAAATAAATTAATTAAQTAAPVANNVAPQERATESTPAQVVAAPSGAGVKAKDHPDYAKFFKLMSMGLPAEQVKMKMQQAGVDPSVLDDPEAIIGGSGGGASEQPAAGIMLVKDDEKYAKFFKLAKMGMPAEQIKLKMSAEGLDPSLLDTPDAPMPGSQPAAVASQVMAVKDDPEYEKFFKLIKMGMPAEQVKMKMSASGLNADLLDTPDAPSPNQKAGAGGSSGGVLAGLPPPTEAVKVDPSALKASLANKLQRTSSSKKPEEPQLPKKETVKPNIELRPLFWTRVPVNVVSSTLWMKLNDANGTFDVDEMEWLFRKNPVDNQKKDDKKKDAAKEAAQPQTVLLLDPKRQQNVSIAIARFRMSATDIKNAIYALDGAKLTSEILNVLISISPTLEEQDLMKNYDGDEKLLGNVEKFFLELLTIPRYTQRIKCLRYKLQFENRILETQAQLDTLVAATDQVTESDKFRRVLENVLKIGNYLNGSTPRGGAYGFKLDTLTKLHTLKSVDPRITLMHFLLRQLEENSPDIIAVAGEVPHIGEAKRLSLDQLRADLSSYNTELAMLQGQVRASKNDKIEGDKFYEQMAPFAQDAAEVLEELGRDFNALERSYHELVSSFGEDPRKMGPMEFFSILEEFVNEFKKAYRQNQTKEFQAIYESAREARAEAIRLAEEEKAAQLKREAEERHAEETKEVYAHVINVITAWAQSHKSGHEAEIVEHFKELSRSFADSEMTSDEYCEQMRKLVSSKVAGKVIPDSAKLLFDPAKREDLMAAFGRFVEQVKKEKESKRRSSLVSPPATLERPRAVSSGSRRRNKVSVIKVEDIEPVVGEAAAQLHKSILESVQQAFGGDTKKMKVFTSNARKYGSEQISAREFYQYLTASFEPDFVGRLVPDLARLLQDSEKRHALIRALCESAPGWEKFSGL
ncbi:Formin-homology 2 domain-containing protein, partial [Globisporangium splendens]